MIGQDLPLDSLANVAAIDSLKQDSIIAPITSPTETVDVSKDGLDEPVKYSARDSMIFDAVNEQVHLYGDASVIYGELTLDADYIILNQKDNTVSAEYLLNELGKKTGIPEFKEGELGFKAQKMKYNFITKKGIIFDVDNTLTSHHIGAVHEKVQEKLKRVKSNKKKPTKDW